ncbi:redoxin domain-containing protein [Rhodocaloribacter litoris]|uniref:redoxin domain-containing protein n=1 Tax=Rhodocaloribacter litoris TaxID=2558931 RepID=UPI00141F8168|nr:redoxin domain-containing protein [Rhodocaloribacter litoris]QXD15977.1 redoxin domain-containing protein [Rhodocaloribacter litoris]GIV59697.1 MAG: anti-oxidant AhpCTSA family protein [Rhodothermaceae bacterium]
MGLRKGDEAPNFTLYDDRRKPFELASLRGKKHVVLLFFPGAFTSVCTTELNMVNNDLEAFGPDTQVVGISTDSPFVLAEFKKVHGLRFPLLSDHDAEVCAAYGAKYNRDFTPMQLDRIARRAAFVVDKKGRVQYAEVLENAGELPDLEAIKALVAEL